MTNEQLQTLGESYWPDASPEHQLSLASKLEAAKAWMRERGCYAFEVNSAFKYSEAPKVLRTEVVV